MNKGHISIYLSISLLIIAFVFITYGEAVENTAMGLINAGTMPEKYHSSEGWGVDYAPVEHFMIVSLAFTLLYYAGCLLKNKRDLIQKILIGFYCLAYIFTLIEFWQMIGITLIPMILITGLAIRCIIIWSQSEAGSDV